MSKVSDSNKMVLCHFFKYCNLLKPISPSLYIVWLIVITYILYFTQFYMTLFAKQTVMKYYILPEIIP